MSESGQSTFAPGSMCAKFRIEKLLGKGGMGEVYLAVDTFLGRRVALKVLPFKRSLDPSFRDRMQREAAAGARVEHPNVTRILDGGATENHIFYVVMELLEGMRTLRTLCHKIVLPLDSGLIIAIQIAEGLSAVHAAGIVHRDLKPENIAVLPGGVVKIIDFGLAKVRSEWIRTSFDPSQGNQRMGTAHYMAPEQIDNRKDDIGTRSDVYALGCILFEVFSGGRHVFQRDSDEFPEQMAAVFAHVSKEPPRLDSPEIDRDKHVPPALADLVGRCLAKDVATRPDADDVARALRKILGEVKAQPVSSGADTARTDVPTDLLSPRESAVPSIDLPPLTAPSDKTVPVGVGPSPTPPAVMTPEAWEMRASPPRGFAPVLATEPLASVARPTLESPQPQAEVKKLGLPKTTVRMDAVPARPAGVPLRPAGGSPEPHSPHAPAVSAQASSSVSAAGPAAVAAQVVVAAASAAAAAGERRVAPTVRELAAGGSSDARRRPTMMRGGRALPATDAANTESAAPRPLLAQLWYHRVSIAPGLLLGFAIVVVWTLAMRAKPSGVDLPSRGADVRSASSSVAAPSAPPAPEEATSARPAASAKAIPSEVSPTGSVRSWSGPTRPGQSPTPRPAHFNPGGL